MPFYEYLTVEKMQEWAKGQPEVFKYLPAEEDLDALPRAWIVNVLYTVLGKTFSTWVDAQIEKRNKERATEKNQEAVLLPKFWKSFKASTDVSGKFLHCICCIKFF